MCRARRSPVGARRPRRRSRPSAGGTAASARERRRRSVGPTARPRARAARPRRRPRARPRRPARRGSCPHARRGTVPADYSRLRSGLILTAPSRGATRKGPCKQANPERRRNRTFQPWGFQGLPVLKGGRELLLFGALRRLGAAGWGHSRLGHGSGTSPRASRRAVFVPARRLTQSARRSGNMCSYARVPGPVRFVAWPVRQSPRRPPAHGSPISSTRRTTRGRAARATCVIFVSRTA